MENRRLIFSLLLGLSALLASCQMPSSSSVSFGTVPGCDSNGKSDLKNPHCNPSPSPSQSLNVSAASEIIPVGWNYIFDSQNNLYSQAPPQAGGAPGGLLKTSPAGATSTYFAGQWLSLIAKDSSDNIYVMIDSNADFAENGSDAGGIAIQKLSPNGATSVFCNSAACTSLEVTQGVGQGQGVVDSHGNLFVPVVFWNNQGSNNYAWTEIAKITPSGGYSIFTGNTVSPGGNECLDGNTGTATLAGPTQMTIDASDNIYVLDIGIDKTVCNSIREITPTGTVSTLHSFGSVNVFGLTRDASGNFYYFKEPGVQGYSISKLSPSGTETPYCGGGAWVGDESPVGPCSSSFITQIVGTLQFDASGDLFFLLNWSGNPINLPYYQFFAVTSK